MIYLSVFNCAKLCGMNRQAIYKMIDRGTIPFCREMVFGKSAYRIPVDGPRGLIIWLESEINRYEKKISILKKSHQRLKEVLRNGGRTHSVG